MSVNANRQMAPRLRERQTVEQPMSLPASRSSICIYTLPSLLLHEGAINMAQGVSLPLPSARLFQPLPMGFPVCLISGRESRRKIFSAAIIILSERP